MTSASTTSPSSSSANSSSISASVREYLIGLQTRITDTLAAKDGGSFLVDAWHKGPQEQLQGDGITKILEDGKVFERAGCGFSHVRGPKLPPSATQHRPELAGAPPVRQVISVFSLLEIQLVPHAEKDKLDFTPVLQRPNSLP